MIFPLGYKYSSVYAGIRKQRKDDLALIVSDPPASAAAVFTENRVQAAPVRIARFHLEQSRGLVSAVLINAGNANCATRTGDRVALACCDAVGKQLHVPAAQVFPVIYRRDRRGTGSQLNHERAAEADPRPGARPFRRCGARHPHYRSSNENRAPEDDSAAPPVRIAGMTKGSGMIHPRMATTLGFVMTDAVLAPSILAPMLAAAVKRSYNRISVDGDTSTNDTLLVLANGASGVEPTDKELAKFEETLTDLLEDLAKQIVRDGEGARKLVTIEINGAASEDSADRIARAIANSPLVKTAIAGSDPNWGRILSAAGNAGVAFDPSKVDIHLQGVLVCQGGVAADFSESELKKKLDEKECLIRFVIHGRGSASARFWTCDLTEKYIEINASYRT